MTPEIALSVGRRLLYREAALLDERRWQEWIALFASDCEYWVPTWLTEETLTRDPQRELSHAYYASRAGLEDRIVRITSGRSPASTPLRRTAHVVSNVECLTTAKDEIDMRSTWANHVFDPHHRKTYTFFGYSLHSLVLRPAGWLIGRKKVVLQNDYMPSVVDVYCL